MRIVVLSQFYDPEPETIPHVLAKGMVARGHQVTAITGFPNYPQGRIFAGYHQRPWQWETRDGVRVLRLPLYPDHSRSTLGRTAYYASLALSASLIGPLLSGKVDVIWVYHTLPLGISAWWIGLLRRAPFVFDVQDMYPESLSATGFVSKPAALNAVGRLAKFIYARSSAISVISPGFKRNLVAKGVPGDKIHVMPNWADEEIYRPVHPDETLAREVGMNDRFNIVYGGSMGPPQGLHHVVEAASRLTELPDIQFVLIGDGLDRGDLERLAESRGLSNVRFLPRQPEERMPSFYALADVLLVHLTDDPVFEITIPSKTLSYLACGRPLLMAVKGDAADLVVEAGAGVCAWPSNPDDLADAVRDLYSMSREERQKMGDGGRAYFSRNFTKDRRLERYNDLFQRLTS